jgi:hypothetical protein
MGTNGFQMEISGISDEENRPLITQSRKDSRYIGDGFRNCKGFVQRGILKALTAFETRKRPRFICWRILPHLDPDLRLAGVKSALAARDGDGEVFERRARTGGVFSFRSIGGRFL